MEMQPPEGRPEPEITKTDPKAYFLWLRAQGIDPVGAATQVQQRFGKPPSPDDIAKQQENAQLAQAAGSVAGSIGSAYLASQLMGSGVGATSGALAKTGALAAPKIVGVKAIGAGGAQAGATGAGSTLGSIGSVALPVAAAAAVINNAWETGMKDIVRGRGDRADWTNQAVNMTGVGQVANIGLRLLGKRSIGAMMKSGKSQAQAVRDDFRGDLKEANVADKDYNVTLADGSKFNIGLDGKTKYKNVGENIDGKTTRNAWDVDFSNPLAKLASDKIDPMIRGIYGEDNAKAKFFPAQYTGMLVNAATSNAKNEQDVINNIEAMLGKSKFAQQAGVGVKPPPPPKAPKGQVVRVSPGMYVNDKGQVGPAKTVGEALRSNYKSQPKKDNKKG
jgi:hypothetical protein